MTGYESKRAMAQDKLAQPEQERVREALKLALDALEGFIPYLPLWDKNQCNRYDLATTAIKAALAQPAQGKLEQAAFDAWWDTQPRLNETNPCSVDSFEYWAWEGWHAALAQPAQERNFCPRCGKRTADLTVIHTCTPPQEKNT